MNGFDKGYLDPRANMAFGASGGARGLADVSIPGTRQSRTLLSALEMLRQLEDAGQELRSRTGKLRTVLCGPEPEQGGQAEAKPPSAAIDALVEKIEDVNRLLVAVSENISRVEQAIG